MRKILWLIICAGVLAAQTSPGTVQATGNSSLPVKPDQATLDVSVITQGTTAQQAADANASQTTAVINALKQALGASGSVQTVSYSVYARYSNVPGQNDVIVGYTASNTVRLTTNDLTKVGSLIDTANQAGANSVGSLGFGLQDPEPYKLQALTAASKQALTHASAIASGLGGKTGSVVSAQEGATYAPVVTSGAGAAMSVTPVQTGTVTVTATVTITVQLVQ